MQDFSVIIDIYMKFFSCRLLECVDGTYQRDYFDDIYSFEKNFQKEIQYYLYEEHMPDIFCSSKKDIVKLYDSIIGFLRRKLRNILEMINGKELRKILYILSAYQAEFHGRVNLKISGKGDDLNTIHPLERMILELTKNINGTSIIQNICAMDKNVIQLIIQENFMIVNTNEQGSINSEIFITIYGCALVIVELIGIRWLIDSGIYNKPVLSINNGEMQLRGEYNVDIAEFQNKLARDIITYEKNYPQDVKRFLDNNFYKMYGFHITTLEKIVSSPPQILPDKNLSTESNYESIIMEFIMSAQCSIEEGGKIFEYLCINDSKIIEKLSLPPDRDDNRIFEKCIMKIDENRFLYSHVLIGYAYSILLRKLEFNLLEGCRRLNAEIIDKKVKKKFEYETVSFVSLYFPNVMSNVHKLSNGKSLSNEVDAIFVCDHKLFLVECKDVSFQYTPYGFMGDLSDARKYIKKINRKKKSVIDNVDYFEEYYGTGIQEVRSFLVYRTANIVTEMIDEESDTDIMSFEQFKDEMKKLAEEEA